MIEFRRITDATAGALAPLFRAGTAEGFRFVARLASEWADGTTRFDRTGEVLLGAFDGPRLVAVGGVTPDPYDREPGVGRLRRIYVMPDARRHGVGRRLVRALEAAAGEHYDALVLRTETEQAAHFYEALGYTRLAAGGTATHRRHLTPEPSREPR